jgi:hypothetical protein
MKTGLAAGLPDRRRVAAPAAEPARNSRRERGSCVIIDYLVLEKLAVTRVEPRLAKDDRTSARAERPRSAAATEPVTHNKSFRPHR